MENLVNEIPTSKKFDLGEIKQIFESLNEEWQMGIIRTFQGNQLCKSLVKIKTPGQAQCAIKLANVRKWRMLEDFYTAIDNGILNTEEAVEAYGYLCSFKMNNGLVSDSIHRFSNLAREDICKNVKNKTDLELLRLTAEKKNARGEDLYNTFAIIRVLEQSPDKKTKILEKLRKEIIYNKEVIESAHAKYIDREVNTIQSYYVKKAYGRLVKSERQFQQGVRQLPSGLKEADLLKRILPGEVVEIGSKLIVSDGVKLTELKMDKAAFTKLFVSDEHLMQTLLGDCGCISTLDGILSTPKGKSAIYQLFEKVGNDIYINLKGYDKKIKFENGEFKYYRGIAKGAQGIKMLEQALAMAHEDTKQCSKTVITAYKDLVAENGGDFIKIMESLDGVTPEYVLSKIFKANNYKPDFYVSIKNLGEFKNLDPGKNSFTLIGTQEEINGVAGYSIPKWHMCIRHSHNVKKLDDFGNILVTNPHDASFSVKVPAYEALNQGVINKIDFITLI